MRLNLFCYAFTAEHVCFLRKMQWMEGENIFILALAHPVALSFNAQNLFLSK